MIPEIPHNELKQHPITGEIVHEEWRDVVGYEGLYQVSNYGRIKSIDRTVSKSGNWRGDSMRVKGQLVKAFVHPTITMRVQLTKNNKGKSFNVHRLEAIAFIPNPDNKSDVNHKDGNRLNNFIFNIEWNTKSENVQHAYDNGLKIPLRGEECNFSKLTWISVGIIRDAYKSGFGTRKIADYFKMDISSIRLIVKNKTWVL